MGKVVWGIALIATLVVFADCRSANRGEECDWEIDSWDDLLDGTDEYMEANPDPEVGDIDAETAIILWGAQCCHCKDNPDDIEWECEELVDADYEDCKCFGDALKAGIPGMPLYIMGAIAEVGECPRPPPPPQKKSSLNFLMKKMAAMKEMKQENKPEPTGPQKKYAALKNLLKELNVPGHMNGKK